ncbi:Zinc finger homeobox protein 4 [Orchesella cincta]|uniref:Zinc finger homeobox protein 4 n=1 Tax=Orchesella cincta TaxID=48709 RepID=A0A1D2NDI5_ORCCI|nr:Zinc finger homeobox protein 4 [Orchesella cincta]
MWSGVCEGKIVYNPDGSAYIIEDSELSDDETSLDVPEGCIVDGRGANLQFQSSAIPQIANAIYVSRNPALYTALYGQAYSNLLQDKKMVPDIPIIHSYRVFTIRDSKSDDTSAVEDEDQDGDDEEMETTAKSSSKSNNKSRTKSGSNNNTSGSSVSSKSDKKAPPTPFPECASVPIKPILMCFICKLSFGYTKSFVGHAMGDHKLILNDQENDILNQRNISAIIQCVGKNKDPLISFLEPLGNRIGTIPMSNNAAALSSCSGCSSACRQQQLLFRQ